MNDRFGFRNSFSSPRTATPATSGPFSDRFGFRSISPLASVDPLAPGINFDPVEASILNQVRRDPLFRDLYNTQREFADFLGSNNSFDNVIAGNARSVEVANRIEELTDTLSAKYGVDRQQIGSLITDTSDPLGEYVARKARGFLDLTEPVQLPQQMFFRGLSAQLESAQRGDSFFATVNNIARSVVNDVDYAAAFRPGLQEDIIMYGDILRQVGIENQTVIRIGGLLGDLTADPLLTGAYIRGIGVAAKGVGATRAATRLTNIGNRVERFMSPMGVIDNGKSLARYALSDQTLRSIDNRVAQGMNSILNFGMESGFGTVGDWFSIRGRNPLRPDADYMTGGTGAPLEFVESMSRSRATVDDVLERVNENLGRVEATIGLPRVKNVFRRIFEQATNSVKAYEPLADLPSGLRRIVEASATEATSVTSPLAFWEVAEGLKDFRVRTVPGQEAQSLIEGLSVGEELENIRRAIGPKRLSSMEVFNRNATRVRDEAMRLGFDPDIAEQAYRDVSIRLMESDVLIGFHRSLYEPMKETFYENVATRLGMGDQEAAWLWQHGIRAGADGKPPAALLQNPDPKRMQRERRNLFDLGKKGDQARDYFLRIVYDQWNGQGLELHSWFEGLAKGHMRRTYAFNDADYSPFVRSIGRGTSMSNRVIENVLYSEEATQFIPEVIQDLISSYLEKISPTIPETRGFMVGQQELFDHLLRNNVSADAAQAALLRINQMMKPETEDIVRRLKDIASARQGVLGTMAVGPSSGGSFSAERLVPFGQEVLERSVSELDPIARQMAQDFERLLPSQVQGVPSVYLNQDQFKKYLVAQGMEVPEASSILRQLNNVGNWDAEAMAEMGRYLDANMPVLQSARAMKVKYPVQRFLADVAQYARDRNILYPKGSKNVPTNFRLLSGPGYGPLQDTYVHPWMKKEIDNAMRGATNLVGSLQRGSTASTFQAGAEAVAYAFQRISSVITANFLASLPTTTTNVMSGIASVGAAGENVATFSFDLAKVMNDARAAGGLKNLPEYQQMGDLLSGGQFSSLISSNLRSARLEGLGERGNWLDAVDAIADGLTNIARKPLLGRTGGLLGLEAFQFLEDSMKVAHYRRVLQRSNDPLQAYRSARNIVFDYSALPHSLKFLQNTGVLMFPGFMTFMTTRLFDALMKRPGVYANFDRLSDAIWNAQMPSEDIRAGVWASMDDWEKEQGYVPITIDYEKKRFGMLPLYQLIGTRPWAGNPFFSSLRDLGVYGPIFDIVSALGNQGRGSISSRYGDRVFSASDEGTPRQLSQIAQFFYNSYSPAFLSRSLSFPAGNIDEGVSGIIPDLVGAIKNAVIPIEPGSQEEAMRFFNRQRTNKESRTILESAISGLLRNVRIESLDPLINPVIEERLQSDYQDRTVEAELQRELMNVLTNMRLPVEERMRRAREILERRMMMNINRLSNVQDVMRAISTIDDLIGLRNQPTAVPQEPLPGLP